MLASLRQLLGPVAQACTSCAEPSWHGASAAATWARALSHRSASTSARAAEQAPERVHIPVHEVEEDLPQLTARVRESMGTSACTKLRRAGRTPGLIHSLPGNRALAVAFDTKEAARHVRRFGRNGILARPLQINLEGQDGEALATVRVLARNVHVNAVTQGLENLSLMFCPRLRKVAVEVPVELWGDDVAPGVKRGGWLHMVNRTVPLYAEGWAVPAKIELDVRSMKVADVLRFRDVPLPEGCQLRAKDPQQPVVRCALRVGGD